MKLAIVEPAMHNIGRDAAPAAKDTVIEQQVQFGRRVTQENK